jgi:hypothetical protein
MPSITSLVKDIEGVVDKGITVTDEQRKELGDALAKAVLDGIGKKEERPTYLRMSNMGTPCERKLWYSVNKPEDAEPLDAKTKIKFTYGNMYEAFALFLAKMAGHKVEGEQQRMEYNGVVGHRDAVIDGVVVDVKSASAYGMEKFKNNGLYQNDPFGYVDQLNLYRHASQDDPLVTVKGEAAFLAIDKVNGEMVVDIYKKTDKDYDQEIERKKEMLAQPEPPRRHYLPEADGTSGNYKIPTPCGYCAYKYTCYSDANNGQGLRKFLYSNGPRWLTRVVKVPNVPEV